MIHSYDTSIALALGGVPEAVVLKEILYWCKQNEAKGANKHDGEYWTFGSVKSWQEKFPEFPNVGGILNRLVNDGWLKVGNYNKTPFDRTKWYAPTEKSISMFMQMDFDESENRIEQSSEPIPSGNTSGETKIERYKESADRLYKLYPSKCPISGRSLGKCAKDKVKLVTRMKEGYTEERLTYCINRYVKECVETKTYAKNFSTFLNNIPDYEEETPPMVVDDEYKNFQ